MSMTSTPSARAFMQKRAGSIHPGWNMANTKYDPVQDQYVTKMGQRSSVHDAAALHTENFLTVMQKVLEDSPQKAALQGFDIRKAHDWIEVRYEAGLAAQDKYLQRAKGIKGFFPRIGRKIGEMNPAIEPIATTLPAGDYTSLVCGGVVLLFRAFKEAHDVRMRVIEELGEYPDLLSCVERLLKLYPNDERLEHKAIALYNALLIAIEAMIVWFERKSWERAKAVLQQGLYARQLKDKLEHMHHCGRVLKEEADLCDKEKTSEISLAIQETFGKLNDVGEEVRRTSDRNFAAIKNVETLLLAQKDEKAVLLQNTVLFLSGINRLWEKNLAAAEERAEAKAKVAREEAQAQRDRAQLLEEQLRHSLPIQVLSQSYVRQALGVHPQNPNMKARAYTKAAKVHDLDGEITASVVTSEKFRTWYSSATSQVLLVQPPPSTSKTSPASLTAAALFHGLSERKSAVTIAHFCEKDDTSSYEEPVTRLLRSLLLQLLDAYVYDFSDWSQVTSLFDHQENLSYGDLRYFCSLFKYLIKSLPHRAVFCVIDDLRILERQASHESFDRLLDMFDGLVRTCNEEKGITFKLVLLTPQHKGRLSFKMGSSDTLKISEAAQAGGMSAKALRRLLLVRTESSEDLHEAPPAYAELP